MNEENAKKLLFDVADALDEVGLPFCLGSGTLLGAVRDNEFMPIDLDIDLWARAEEFEPLVPAILIAMQNRGLKTEVIDHRHAGYWDGRYYAIKFSGHGEHGDLTAFTKMPGNLRYNPTHASEDPFCIVFNADDFYFQSWPYRLFYGRKFWIPNNFVAILDELYEPQWRIPHVRYDEPCNHPAYKSHFLTKQDIAYVPMCLDVLHHGHLYILAQAAKVGAKNVWIGLLTDEAIQKYKSPPVFNYSERLEMALGTKLADKVVPQEDYLTALLKHKPAYVVHGDDWKKGVQTISRQLVFDILQHWGGKVIEVPRIPGYSSSELKRKIQDTKS